MVIAPLTNTEAKQPFRHALRQNVESHSGTYYMLGNPDAIQPRVTETN